MSDVDQMMARQRALADFGELALRSGNLDEVLTEACRLVGRAFATNLAKVVEIEEEGRAPALFVRAGVGWPPGVVGEVRLAADVHSSESYAIKSGVPIVTSDIREEGRFGFPDFMVEAGVRGMVNVPIFLPGGKPYGLLQVDSREAWDPQDEDVEFLRTYAMILGPVIDRLHKIHALQQATDRNETLLHELQHRIKNNIAAITSLVRLQMRRTVSQEARDQLGIIGERIETLRLVHEQIYAAKNGDRLMLRPYVTALLEGLLALHQDIPVQLEVQMDDVEVNSDTAISLGLILNEFTTNSMKFAFDSENLSEGLIALSADRRDGRLRLRIRDNGKGLPDRAESARPDAGTGMALIERLSRQIGATPEWSSEHGTALYLEFPLRQ